MNERMQFICGAASVLLWLLTVLLVGGYHGKVTSLEFPWTLRETPRQGFTFWARAFDQGLDWGNITEQGFAASRCHDVHTAPLCGCLQQGVELARDECVGKGKAHVLECYMTRLAPQILHTTTLSTRPYLWLLVLNMWAALVGSVLLVKSKLLDRGSYAVQLLVQGVVGLVTLGTMWLSLGSPPSEWATALAVGVAVVVLGWSDVAGDADADWWAHHLSIMYSAVLPALCAINNVYNQRRDSIYMAVTVALSLGAALVAAARSLLERAKGAEEGVYFCQVTVRILALGLIALSYDAQPYLALWSAVPAWWAYALYLGMSLTNGYQDGAAFVVDLVVRGALTVCMLNELY